MALANGNRQQDKMLVFGASGYLGKFMVRACVSMGHDTFAYVRPVKPNSDPSKLQLLKEFESMNVTVVQVCITT